MMPRTRSAVVAILTFSALCGVAHADGLDSGYFVRFDSDDHSWTYFWTVLAIIMLANYILNFIVIGLPAVSLASSRIKAVSVGLIVLTVLGQVADRLGAFAAIFVAMPFMALFSPSFVHQFRIWTIQRSATDSSPRTCFAPASPSAYSHGGFSENGGLFRDRRVGRSHWQRPF
jgi:hypothetical protein